MVTLAKPLLTAFVTLFLCSVAYSQSNTGNPDDHSTKDESSTVQSGDTTKLYPYDPSKAVVDIDAQLKGGVPVILYAPDHPGNQTIELGKQQAADNKAKLEEEETKKPEVVPEQ